MARGGVRLLGLLRPRPGASGSRDVHQPELPAIGGGRARQEPEGLGHSAGPPVPRAQALVLASRRGRSCLAGAPPPRSRERPLAYRTGALDDVLARAGTGAAANRLHPPRAAGAVRRRPGRTYAGLDGARHSLGWRLPNPGNPRRSMVGPGLGRRRAHRATSRRSALELDPPGGERSLRALVMRLERTYSFGRLAVRAFRSGSVGSGALGVGSDQKVAVDQSSRVSTSPSFQAICWMVIRASRCQAIGSARCHRYMALAVSEIAADRADTTPNPPLIIQSARLGLAVAPGDHHPCGDMGDRFVYIRSDHSKRSGYARTIHGKISTVLLACERIHT